VIERATLQRFRLPLRRPLETARGVIAEREGVLLELSSRSGARGFGEAMPLAGWPGEELAAAESWLASAVTGMLGRTAEHARVPLDCAAPLARAALETALLDLAAREAGVPLADALAARPARREVAVNALIAGDRPEEVAEQARREAERGFRAFKLKLGARALGDDLARVAALHGAIGTQAALRLDANGAWSEGEALRALDALAAFAPEYVEEPFAAGIAACARLREHSRVPIALDESACDGASVERALRMRAADVLVLKVPLLGGPRAARAAALRAQRAGVGVVLTSFLDSAVGVAAALHCAASLPDPLRACGLATGALLTCDLAALAPPERGVIALPAGAGLGLAPDGAALPRVASGPLREWRR
jgi:o-succinylbenzoate synthase